MKVSVIIPVYNECESIKDLYSQLIILFKTEIIFVDDGSSDGSVETIKKISKIDTSIKLIEFRRNYGKSAALNVGFKKAKGDVVITMDADLQDSPR